MSIHFSCPFCFRKYKVKDELGAAARSRFPAGRRRVSRVSCKSETRFANRSPGSVCSMTRVCPPPLGPALAVR